MKVYHRLSDFEKGPFTIATIGAFDGVHLGHQSILQQLTSQAGERQGESALISFHPHPRLVLFPESQPLPLLQTLEERIAALETLGVDKLMLIPFTREFSRLTALAFVKEVLVEAIGIRKLIIGYDHHFGKDRSGSVDELRALGPSLGFEVEEIPPVLVDDVKVSSTKIRRAIQENDFDLAAHLLGRKYTFSGLVVHGEKLGRTLGYPTANLHLSDPYKITPADGVYWVEARLPDRQAEGLLSIGTRPTVDGSRRAIEVFLLDYSGDLYGTTLTLTPRKFLRGQQKFGSKDELVMAMKRDEAKVRSLIASANA